MLTQTRDFELEVRSLEDAGLARSEMRNRPEISTFWSGDGDRFRADVAVRRQQLEHATRRERQCLNGLETVLAVLEGRVDDARKQLALQELDTDVERGNHAWNTVVIEWLDGDVAAAFPVVRRAYDDFHGGPLRYTLLWAAGEAGDTDVVDELLDTITPHRVGRLAELMLGGFGLAGLAMTAALRADRALAALVEAELVPLSGQMIGVPWSAFPSVDFFLAVMAAAKGDDRRAKRHRDRAAEVHERMGAPAFDRLIGRYVDL